MATKSKASVAVTPPAISRGGRKSQISAETIASMVEDIENGDFAAVPDSTTDSGLIEYPTKDGSDSDKARKAARGAANSVAVRHKKAIINSADNGIDDPTELKTRVWEVADNVFVWAVGPKQSGDDSE